MPESAQTKSARRKNVRDGFPHPLNKVAIRHVDAISTLSQVQLELLLASVSEADLPYMSYFLTALKEAPDITNKSELVELVEAMRKDTSGKPQTTGHTEGRSASQEDEEYLVELLTSSFDTMPESSATALARSDVMKPCLDVVTTTRHAIDGAQSDFVFVVLYKLFEENLDAIKQSINSNPAFVKAMQLSRPDWDPNK